MLGLSNNEEQSVNNEAFNAQMHIESLCVGSRVRIHPHARITYKKGWASIIEDLMKTIKRHPIEVGAISSEYGQLDFSFYSYEKTQEIKVWRAIDKAKGQSRQSCMECGCEARRRVRGENVVVICRDCIHIAEVNGVTGTWLDKY